MLSQELHNLSPEAKLELASLFVHAAWAGFDMRDRGITRFTPSVEDLRMSRATLQHFISDPSTREPGAAHTAWLKSKQEDGWTYNPVRNNDLKHHPLMVPYEALPMTERLKDANQLRSQQAILSMLGLI